MDRMLVLNMMRPMPSLSRKHSNRARLSNVVHYYMLAKQTKLES